MEKHRHVFEDFASFDRMYDGYLMARRNKRYKQAVLNYTANLEENLITSVNELQWKTYEIGELYEFYEYFPKKRLIFSLPFYDRVINCAAYRTLWPIYSRSFYEHNYGSVPGKGTHAGVKQLQEWLKMLSADTSRQWFLGKMDIAKFFFRIPVEVQLRELGRPLDDPDMMWFLTKAVHGDGRPLGLPLDCLDVATAERVAGRGMQTGSLISQMTANVVLTPLDHYIKRDLRAPYYIRYMDDMIILAPSKDFVWDLIRSEEHTSELQSLAYSLRGNLGLQLNNKTAVMPLDQGVEFIGRRVWPDKVQLRRTTTLHMKQHLAFVREHYATGELPLEYCRDVIVSYLGLLEGTDSDALRDSILRDFVLIRHQEKSE